QPVRQRPDQVFFPLDTAEESPAALRSANDAHAVHLTDTVFSYAGAAKPVYPPGMQAEDLTRFGHGLQIPYLIEVMDMNIAVNRLVSSTLGYLSSIVYSSHPSQNMFGLADSLRSELVLYGVNTFSSLPRCMRLTWTKRTRYLEPTDEGLAAELAAAGLLAGMSSTMRY
ncbi:hypothetical protein DFH29DRAFT_815927, partial [Suillus ampliporus]